MKIFNLINKNGITLHTENKYCDEDIAVGLSPDDQDNLIANNIKSGINILGITGTYEGSGGSGWTNAVVLCNEVFYGIYAKINDTPTDTSDIDYTLKAAYSGVVPITVLDSDNSFINVSKLYLWHKNIVGPGEIINVFINDVNVGTLPRNVITEFEISTSSTIKIKSTQ